MLELQPISISHKPLFDRCMMAEGSGASCASFGNVYLWDLLCCRNVAQLGERMAVEYLCRQSPFYSFPFGSGDIAPFVEALSGDARAKGRAFTMKGLTAGQRELLESFFPGRFAFTEDRDNADYFYTVEAFSTLSGKKLHGKRNFCNRFEASHRWRFEPMAPAFFEDCRSLLRRWEEEKNGDEEERLAILRVFEEWDALGMFGGVLFAEERPIAFSIGETIRADTVDIHFEKALDDVPGAYPMIARETARLVKRTMPGIRFLNREEDMGLPGLRKAKEEWYPCAMGAVYIATEKCAP